MRTYCLFVLLGGIAVGKVFSQPTPTEKLDSSLVTVKKRLDFDLANRRIVAQRVMPLGTEGLLLFIEGEEILRNMRKEITIAKYDTALNLKWAQRYAIDASSNMNIYAQQGDHLYFLIPKSEYRYDILRLNVVHGQLYMIRYDKLVDMEVSHFAVMNDIILIGGQVNGNPAVIHYDYKHAKPKILPSLSQLKGQISRMDVSPEHNAISVIISSSIRRKASFYHYIYNGQGQLLYKRIVPHEQEYSIVNFRPYFISQSKQLLLGLYSLTTKEKSQGIYVALFEENQKKDIKFYDFSFLKNFFNYMPPRRREKVILRLRDKRQEGKIPKLDYNFFARNLLVTPERILFIADSYIPVFVESTMGRFAIIGSPFFNSFSVNTMNPIFLSYNNLFWLDRNMVRSREGNRIPTYYRYKHTVICAFDKTGKLIWDNSFEYKDVELKQPAELLQINFNNDYLQMIYYHKEKLYYKQTYRSLPNETIFTTQIPIKQEEKSLIGEREDEQVAWWYNNYFILFGKQEIKSSASENAPVRKRVFYIAKTAIHPASAEEKQKQ
ncbi:MAG: hypothetical protein RMJ44_10645 [Cytophagales bacterium]|nr:hypothetical protein [Bernardetiaceae bacterium]MDW8211532.1 hypothetical protein [Cytophagales bacterium]